MDAKKLVFTIRYIVDLLNDSKDNKSIISDILTHFEEGDFVFSLQDCLDMLSEANLDEAFSNWAKMVHSVRDRFISGEKKEEIRPSKMPRNTPRKL